MKILQGYHLTTRDRAIIKTFVNDNLPVGETAGTAQIVFKLTERDGNRLKFKRYQYGGWATASDRNGKIIEVTL